LVAETPHSALTSLCLQEALKRRIERAFFHLEEVVGSLLDVLHEGVAVSGLAAKRLEDHHLECARKQIARKSGLS
jgi:hypothetical protein